jgi:hypothetical protein
MASYDLKTASVFALLSSAALSSTGGSVISNGQIGSASTTAGFPPGILMRGSILVTDALIVSSALQDLTDAYNSVKNSASTAVFVPAEMGGLTLTPNIYYNTGAVTLATGSLTLDGPGQYIFRFNAAMSIAASVSVILINGALPDSIVWQVSGAFAMGANASISGVVMCYAAIAVGNQCTVAGQLLSLTGALAIDNTCVTRPDNAVQLAAAAVVEKVRILALTTTSTLTFTVELPDATVVTYAHIFGESCDDMITRMSALFYSSVPIASDSRWVLSCNGELLTSYNFLQYARSDYLCVLQKSDVFWHPHPADAAHVRQLMFLTDFLTSSVTVDDRFSVKFTQRALKLSLASGSSSSGQQIWIDSSDLFIAPSSALSTVIGPVRVVMCSTASIKIAQLIV